MALTREQVLEAKRLLELAYADGITGIESIESDGTTITGVARDEDRRIGFTMKPDDIATQVLIPEVIPEANQSKQDSLDADLIDGTTPAQQRKIETVMGEFKQGKLKSGSGDVVTSHKQAMAIAMSEAGVSQRNKDSHGKLRSTREERNASIQQELSQLMARADKNEEPLKRVVKYKGLDLGITHDPGDDRFGNKVSVCSYGHIRKHHCPEDGMALDVFLGPDLESDRLFEVSQLSSQTGEYEQPKIMIGFGSEAAAKRAYMANRPAKMFGGIKSTTMQAIAKHKRKDNSIFFSRDLESTGKKPVDYVQGDLLDLGAIADPVDDDVVGAWTERSPKRWKNLLSVTVQDSGDQPRHPKGDPRGGTV